jgi:hypothetical protein
MKTHAVRFAFCMLAMGAVFPQASRESSSPPCVPELLNRAGWTIPGLDNASTKLAGVRLQLEGAPDDVFTDSLEPKDPTSEVVLVRCVPGQPGRFEVRNQRVRVKELLRFKRHGRVFAFRVNLWLEASNGEALGAAEVLLFYDPDGSGRFTVQRDVAGLRSFIVVPAWVKSM